VHPNSTPAPGDLPGVDDYRITIPVHRADDVHGDLRFRIPATAGPAAVALGEQIAEHLAGTLPNIDGQAPWRIAVADVTAERVDTRTLDEAVAEIDHWKRIVTALARKMPGMVQVSAGEYQTADTTDLAVMPGADPETMMFVTPAFYAEMAAALAEQHHPVMVGDLPEHEEPLLLPAADDVVLPAQPGGVDPDVRRVRVGRLGEFHAGTVEVFLNGWWLPVENVETGDDLVVLHVNLRHTTAAKPGTGETINTLAFADPKQLLTVRPATIATAGYRLGSHLTPSIVGHQLLHDGAWWTVTGTGWEQIARFCTAELMNADRGELSVNVPEDDRILLRRRRPGAWS
jgi:hypothetical protein